MELELVLIRSDMGEKAPTAGLYVVNFDGSVKQIESNILVCVRCASVHACVCPVWSFRLESLPCVDQCSRSLR